MKRLLCIVALAVVAVAPIFYLVYHFQLADRGQEVIQDPQPITEIQFQKSNREISLEPGISLDVLACKVIDGYRFGLILEGDNLIEAHLSVATKESAVPVVVGWLNEVGSTPPVVILRRKVDNYWIVDLILNKSGKKINMVDALESEGLLLR